MSRDIVQDRHHREVIQELKRTNQLLEQVLIALNKPGITVEQKGQFVDAQLSGYLGRKADTHGRTAGASEEGGK